MKLEKMKLKVKSKIYKIDRSMCPPPAGNGFRHFSVCGPSRPREAAMQPVGLPVSRSRETGSLTGCIAASRGREGPQTLNCLKPSPADGGLVLRTLSRDSPADGKG